MLHQAFGEDYAQRLLAPTDYNAYVSNLKRFVEQRLRAITTHQLRNIFSQVKRASSPTDLQLLRPKLAYVAGREDKDPMSLLVVLLDDLIQQVRTTEDVRAFVRLFEAVIAYHKYFNPKADKPQ